MSVPPSEGSAGPDLLVLENVSAGYNRVDILADVTLRVGLGEAVAVLGRNGAGKSTLLRTISRMTRLRQGSILVSGRDVTRAKTPDVAALGVAHVPEGRHVFPKYSVNDNLLLGGFASRGRRAERHFAERLERVYEHFPELAERRRQTAGTLSGGEQQMVAIGMALMANPKLLMLDEPSLGLAPVVVARVFDAVTRLRAEGTTILIVEQLVNQTLALVDRAYVLELGRVVAAGASTELAENRDALEAAYLG